MQNGKIIHICVVGVGCDLVP